MTKAAQSQNFKLPRLPDFDSRRLHSESEDDDEEANIPVRAWPSQSSLHSTDDV